jgi:hypothetical protein
MGPARRASVMLWVIGGLGAACGLCVTTAVWLMPVEQLVEQMRASMSPDQQRQLANMDIVKIFRIAVTIGCVLGLVVAVVMLGTAGFVRRGNRPAIVTAIVACSLLGIGCALRFMVDVAAIAVGTQVLQSLGDIVFWIAVGVAVGMTIRWLIQAMSASKRMAQQQLMQYWRYQQQQQPIGYGYGATPGAAAPANVQTWLNLPPPPPAVPPPSPSPAGDSGEGIDDHLK